MVKSVIRFTACMLCKYIKLSYARTKDAITFNIKYCGVFFLFFHAAMSEVHSKNQNGHLVYFGQLVEPETLNLLSMALP